MSDSVNLSHITKHDRVNYIQIQRKMSIIVVSQFLSYERIIGIQKKNP